MDRRRFLAAGAGLGSTQKWLATRDAAEALTSGGYWLHQQREQPHPAVNDTRFPYLLLADLTRATGTKLA